MNKEVKEEDPKTVHPIIYKKINRSLKRSIVEGQFVTASTNLGPAYFTPFALALNATSGQIGLMHSLINLLPSIAQLQTSKLIEKYSRKKITMFSSWLAIFMLIPIIISGFLFKYSIPYAVEALIGFVVLFYLFSGPALPAWFSWMGSLVSETERGRYFSIRNRASGFMGLIAMVIGAFLLDYFKTTGMVILGFGILFAVSFLLRVVSLTILNHQYEPKLKVHKSDYFSLRQFIKNSGKSSLGRFSFYSFYFRIAAGIATPFFAVFLLKNLGLSYVWFMAITVSSLLFQLVFMPALGRISDRMGNVRVLKMSSISIAIVPLLFLVSKNPWYLLIVPQIVAGFGWAGFNLASGNYIYDTVSQERRSFGVTYYSLFLGLGNALGAIIGSFISLISIPALAINNILLIFFVSGILRVGVVLFFRNHLREVRVVKKFSTHYVVNEIVPVRGITREFHSLAHPHSKIIHKI